ncbi:transferase [Nostocales cyanobacterium HT-58-2]|nr:transferase [Nostocales cyanobacterium HT-58-2]
MSVPPLRLSDNFDSYMSGEVIIHPSAVIAPGVILQAASNSKIIIGPGVCVGMGSILQASEGTLEVEAGANLGAGLLMVGKGKIGANACIGAATTIFNCSVEPGQVVTAGSVLGDTSRRAPESSIPISETRQPEASATDFASTSIESQNGTGRQQGQGEQPDKPIQNSEPPPTLPSSPSSLPAPTQESQIGSYIYGQESIQRLLITLFPHKQPLNKPTSDGQPE